MKKTPLRVLSVVSTLAFGGDENRQRTFVRAMDRERICYSIVQLAAVADELRPEIEIMLNSYRELGIPVTDLAGPGPLGLAPPGLYSKAKFAAASFPMMRRLQDLVARERVDVIDARMGSAIAVGALVGWMQRVPVVATDYGPSGKRLLRRASHQLAIPVVDAFVSDSHKRLEETRAWLFRRPARMRVIPNGIYEPRSTRSRAEMRAILGLPADDRVRIVVQVSRVEPHKGIMELLLAARSVLRKVPGAAFLVCGVKRDPGYHAAVLRKAAELGIADKVVIRSYMGDIADVWQVADVHVHASLMDSSPIAIHESMALGLPGVFTDTGGVPELVEPGETALLVPVGDTEALAGGIERLLTDRELAERLGRHARRRYEMYHRPEVMAEAITQLFEEVAAARRVRR